MTEVSKREWEEKRMTDGKTDLVVTDTTFTFQLQWEIIDLRHIDICALNSAPAGHNVVGRRRRFCTFPPNSLLKVMKTWLIVWCSYRHILPVLDVLAALLECCSAWLCIDPSQGNPTHGCCHREVRVSCRKALAELTGIQCPSRGHWRQTGTQFRCVSVTPPAPVLYFYSRGRPVGHRSKTPAEQQAHCSSGSLQKRKKFLK